MSNPIAVAVSTAYERQFKKLKTDQLKQDARQCRRDIYECLTLQRDSGDQERIKEIIRDRRLKPIQRFRKKVPKRWEATFAPDGRIVWSYDGQTFALIYIGNHSVLDKD
ncbi:hypothetical protein ACPPVW_18205 [Leifsonia sp. McL0607]|uniref:hypothetical protein n=1 Tax=Leifsonia sp. McL0607 TaxID=3415672 RepID=UPI003CEF5B32